MALRWILQQPVITSVIIGARTETQFLENVKASGWSLDQNVLRKLSDVSHLPDRYPEAMEKNMHERRDSAVRKHSSPD